MIPPTSTMVQIDTLPGEEIEFTISSARWVMSSLADLYSNKELACTREYSTNARDAMVEAGNGDRPIEVSLPTMMNPYFKVRDNGPGMSEHELKTTYTQFGNSTKRDSNDYNGVLGFGSKSAIAYTTTFTVTAVKDGIKTVAVVNKKPDDAIVLKVVMSSKTDDENGVEVSIPVHNHVDFAAKARDFYRFWLPGTVLVDGVEPVRAVGEKLSENLYYSTAYNTSYVVMGNVAYRIANPDALFRDARISKISFVAYVENGAVEFTPSREDLKYTELTKKTLADVISGFEEKILKEARDDIDQATDFFDAYSKWVTWTNKLGKGLFGTLKFNGTQFQTDFAINGMRYKPGGYGYSTQRVTQWSVESMSRTLIITGYDLTLSSAHKAKAREYTSLTAMTVNNFIFTHEKAVTSPWVDQTRLVDWETLKAALPKKVRAAYAGPYGPGRIRGTFDYFTAKGYELEKSIPDNTTLYYIRVKDEKGINVVNAMKALKMDGAVVVLAFNRIPKFVRENPTSTDFLDYAKSFVVRDGSRLLNTEAREALAIGMDTRRWINSLDISKLDDPEFQRIKALIADKDKHLEPYQTNLTLAESLGMRYDVSRHKISESNEALHKPYPLLSAIGHYNSYKAHIELYINAAFAAKKGKK